MLVRDIPQDTPGSNRLPPLPGEADADEILARRLRALREAAQLTQRQLADRMAGAGYQMHQTTIAKIEAGQRPVIVGEAVAFARIIGVDLADLVTEPPDDVSAELAQALAELGSCERAEWELAVQAERAQAVLEASRNQHSQAQAKLAEVHHRVLLLRARLRPRK